MSNQFIGLIIACLVFASLESIVEPRIKLRDKVINRYNLFNFSVFSLMLLIFAIISINVVTKAELLKYILFGVSWGSFVHYVIMTRYLRKAK